MGFGGIGSQPPGVKTGWHRWHKWHNPPKPAPLLGFSRPTKLKTSGAQGGTRWHRPRNPVPPVPPIKTDSGTDFNSTKSSNYKAFSGLCHLCHLCHLEKRLLEEIPAPASRIFPEKSPPERRRPGRAWRWLLDQGAGHRHRPPPRSSTHPEGENCAAGCWCMARPDATVRV